MKAQKWDYKDQKYYDYEVPKNATMLEIELDMIVACADCGEPELFGRTYTSRVIHNDIGLGWNVCKSCHEVESIIEREYQKEALNGL